MRSRFLSITLVEHGRSVSDKYILSDSYGYAGPILPSGVPNGEDSKLCAADGWIDEGWEHVTGTLSKLSG